MNYSIDERAKTYSCVSWQRCNSDNFIERILFRDKEEDSAVGYLKVELLIVFNSFSII